MNSNKDEKLIDLLRRLANEEELTETIEQYTNEFQSIYVGDYRHKYSDIHSVLLNLSQEERDYLSESLKAIYENTSNDFKEREKLLKLYDHIQLENMRNSELREYAEMVKAFEGKYAGYKDSLKETENQLLKAQKDLNDTQRYIKGLEEKLRNSETQSITILGIFTGIVMTFTGGLSFTTSTLQTMNEASKYRLVFIILIVAATIFNIIYMLIYSIGKMNGTYIGSNCNCDNKIRGCKDKRIRCSMIRYPIAIWVNFIVLIGLISTLLLYFIDRYNLITLVINKNKFISISIGLIIFVAIIIGVKFIIKFNKSICKYEYKESVFSNFLNPFASRYVKKEDDYNMDI